MKKLFCYLICFLIFSCNSDEENNPSPTEFNFNYNLHNSLPTDWVSEFNIIMVVFHWVTSITSPIQ